MWQRLFLLFALSIPLLARGDQPLPKGYEPPVLTTSAIIEVYDKEGNFEGIVLIDRKNEPLGKALPGGLVNRSESLDRALRREAKEETELNLHELRQFHVYSDPKRDPRWHAVDVTYLAKAYSKPKAGDDATTAIVVPLEVIPFDELSFDHAQIIRDYLTYKEGQTDIAMLKP